MRSIEITSTHITYTREGWDSPEDSIGYFSLIDRDKGQPLYVAADVIDDRYHYFISNVSIINERVLDDFKVCVFTERIEVIVNFINERYKENYKYEPATIGGDAIPNCYTILP